MVTLLQILVAVLPPPLFYQRLVFKFEDLSFLGDHVVHRTEACAELVVDESKEEGEGGEGGDGHGHHCSQVSRWMRQCEPEHEDGHARVLDSGLDGDGNDVFPLPSAQL